MLRLKKIIKEYKLIEVDYDIKIRINNGIPKI